MPAINVCPSTRVCAMIAFVLASVSCTALTESNVRERPIGTQLLSQVNDRPWVVRWGNDTELLFVRHWDWPYTDPKPSLDAIDVRTGNRRTVAPAPPDNGVILSMEVVHPYVYYAAVVVAESRWTLRRVSVSGGEVQTIFSGTDPLYVWAVSADHRVMAYGTASRLVVVLDLGSRRADTVSMAAAVSSHDLMWISPDGGQLVTLGCCTGTAVVQRVIVGSRQVSQHDVPSIHATSRPMPRGQVVRWEEGLPVMYYFVNGSGVRYPLSGSAETRASTGGVDGAWAPSLDRVGAWTRRCVRREPLTFGSGDICVHSEHDLIAGRVGGSPEVIGTFVSREPDHMFSSTAPAFSPGNAFVAYMYGGGSSLAGVYVAPIR